MVQPPPPSGPPPHSRRPVRPRPPPPPRPSSFMKSNTFPKSSNSGTKPSGCKRPTDASSRGNVTSKRKIDSNLSTGQITMHCPLTLRDVTVYQKKHQVGQGTYGSVFMGADKDTGEIVALKRINTEQEENGFPITAIREVKILKALSHTNIVKLKQIVTSKEDRGVPSNVFMVFEYLEYDLTGILETKEITLTADHIKSWSQQLLSGVHYMHTNGVIHRDLKASNLLVNRNGELKIADWGLARSWNQKMKRLTNRVITLWYRPPELLLGSIRYCPKIDMWSVGCIIAEMFRRSGFLKGGNESTQLDLIFKTAGHPTLEEWPSIHQECPLWKNYEPKNADISLPRNIRDSLKVHLPNPQWMTEKAKDIIDNLMVLNPACRWSAAQALDADYFFEDPIVKPANKLLMKFRVDSVHEWEARKKSEQLRQERKDQAKKHENVQKGRPSSNRVFEKPRGKNFGNHKSNSYPHSRAHSRGSFQQKGPPSSWR